MAPGDPRGRVAKLSVRGRESVDNRLWFKMVLSRHLIERDQGGLFHSKVITGQTCGGFFWVGYFDERVDQRVLQRALGGFLLLQRGENRRDSG